ncbi:sulfatase [Cytophaga sp. FL35]|uniref:sulfatase n=1 Tax=Cytophaga sp. FL35 TaxID=1904456 RepID=UPI0025712514|nr:sulfatase [Cytophaga sp. FL35]
MQKPNIIFIMADDLGWRDGGIFGSKFYETPNIDKLASSGMLFTHGYAGAANCAPSRACLISGQNTPRHGIYTVANSDRGKSSTRKIVPVENNTVLGDSLQTLAAMLKKQGYHTATFGKWHLSEDPLTYGFDRNVGGDHRGNPGGNGYFAPFNVPGLNDAPVGENLTDRLTDEAIAFMSDTSGGPKPFFVYLSYYAVHTPLATKPELLSKYETKKGNQIHNNATYAGMLETLDYNIGKLLGYLKENNLSENTLVVFTSDNGGIRAISRQDPLRAGKGSYYEGGIRVPFVFSWPGKIAPASVNDQPISNLDIYPTLMDISGAEHGNNVLDGISVLPALEGAKLPERDFFFHFPIYLQAYDPDTDGGRDSLFRTRPGSVIVSGRWKLHQYFEDGDLELYDLNSDWSETHNLIHEKKEIAHALLGKLELWRKETNAPVPTEKNPDYDPDFHIN